MSATVPNQQITVRPLTADHLDDAAAVLALAFSEEPGNRVLLPDPEARLRLLRTATRNQLRATLPLGTVHVATLDDRLGGVAIWHPPGRRSASLPSTLRAAKDSLTGVPALARQLPTVATVLAQNLPGTASMVLRRRRGVARASAGASWHLAFLATDPELRGRGLARALLDRQLTRCDEDRAPVWLETTDPVNPPLYERFGFVVTTHLDRAGWLPGLWIMRREPQ